MVTECAKSGHKILVVDDAAANVKLLNEMLGQDYEVLAATNGEDALSLASTQSPDLILLDVVMPDMDGYAVCRALKANEDTKNIPVIFITSMHEQEDERKGLEIGAIDYITKPFSFSLVKARVKNHIVLNDYRRELECLCKIDALTGIFNRRSFEGYLCHEWRRSLRYMTPLSIIMADIDFFKSYNDHYGHVMGDECIKKVAASLEGALKRPTDIAARYGGEEFVCVLSSTDISGALTVAADVQRAVLALNIPHEFSNVAGRVTLSIGVATIIPSVKISTMDLLRKADDMLYEAKNAGRNTIISFDIK